MDASVAQSLASGIDPRAISALKAHPNDPSVRRAVANQFGAMLMEGMMRNADGSPLSMVGGVGGDTVSELYTNVMSQVAASSNQLGFADMLLQSMPKAAAGASTTGAATTTAAPSVPSPITAVPTTAMHGFSLLQYWQGRHVITRPGAPLAIAPPGGAHPFAIVPQAGVVPGASATAPMPSPATTPTSAPSTSPYGSSSGPSQLSPATGAMLLEGTQQHFAASLAPLLQNAAQSLGVSPNVLLAQAALESGWGHSMPGNNIFGVKAGSDWTGGTVQAYTHEMSPTGETGQTTSFRAYPSLTAAVADYVNLIAHNARYRSALGAGNDPLAYGQALVAGGYATDPDYASKLAAVAASPTITAALDATSGVDVAQATTTGGDA
ncbi:MAG: glucosaminidase domain-containing protein [Stellaceae bacterium]